MAGYILRLLGTGDYSRLLCYDFGAPGETGQLPRTEGNRGERPMVECDQCGARRPQRGPCPECGAPPPGTFNSMRQWKDRARTGEGPAVGQRGGGARGSGAGWQRGGGWDDEDDYDQPPARSGRNRRRGGADYEEVDL